jgi:hypothetical protein
MGKVRTSLISSRWSVVCSLLLILLSAVSAADFNHVVTNSEDWVDVYSGIHYANLLGVSSDFLTSQNHANILLKSMVKGKNVRVLTSKDNPYVFNYPDLIITEGFSSADEIVSRNLNLELVEDLEEINNFVIIDDSYGYNSVAVVPYAIQKNSWVFFANRVNIDDIDQIISGRASGEILIYGYVDREVRDVLEKYNPKVINNQDKFEDNIQIVEEYLKLYPRKQALLTNGEFIEKELMMGVQPILFTGRENVPDKIRDYLKISDIEIGVLIGNELMGAATNIRRSTGISVMVKFARGARTQTSGISAVEGLDLFPLPVPSLSLEVYSVEYNKIANQLEVTYKSSSNAPVYFKGTITIKESDGEKVTLGDIDQIFISPGSYQTVSYDVGVSSFNDLKAHIFTLYGETKSSLDRVLDEEWDVSVVDVVDDCQIEVSKVVYNKQSDEFLIHVKNVGDTVCWVDAALEDLLVGYEEKIISTDRAYRVQAGKKEIMIIEEELLDEDIERNSFINLLLHYGEKETSLVKIIKGRFELKVSSVATVTYVLILLSFGAGIFFFLFFWRKRKEKMQDDGFEF